MIKVYTIDEAKRDMDALLDDAERGGDVRIQRPDGSEFVVRPVVPDASTPIDYEECWKDLPVIGLDLTVDEIVQIVREGREYRGEGSDLNTPPVPSKATTEDILAAVRKSRETRH